MKSKTNIISLIIAPFKYCALGCYYTLYGILFPFLFIFNKLNSASINAHNKKELYKSNNTATNMNGVVDLINLNKNNKSNKDSENVIKEDKYNYENKEVLKNHKKNLKLNKINKKNLSKRLSEREKLIKILKEDNQERNSKPITFQYYAISDGRIVNGFIEAFSKQEVFEFLESQDYQVYKISANKFIESLYGKKQFSKKKLKTKDLIFWLTQLSTYLKSGIPLTDAMRILSLQLGKKDKTKKRIFESVVFRLIMGDSFSIALEKQGNAFPPLLINMIKAAEATGELEETLDDQVAYYNEIETTRKQMISALTYPSIVMVFALAVTTFMLIYIVPQFSGIYDSAGVELNGFTLFVLAASDFLKKNIIYILIIVLIVIIALILIYKYIKLARYYMQYFAMKLPLFGKIIIYKEITIFTKTFSSLLKNNVFITDSMEILSKITSNEIYKDIMYQTINNIAYGDKISSSFKDNWAVPDVAYYMIVTGESTGELAEMMGKVSVYYQEEHRNIINALKSLIEPVMIVLLAGVVGSVIIAILVPMFSLYGQIS